VDWTSSHPAKAGIVRLLENIQSTLAGTVTYGQAITKEQCMRTGAGLLRVAIESTWAGVHCGDEHKVVTINRLT
jgi:hypothetical protein